MPAAIWQCVTKRDGNRPLADLNYGTVHLRPRNNIAVRRHPVTSALAAPYNSRRSLVMARRSAVFRGIRGRAVNRLGTRILADESPAAHAACVDMDEGGTRRWVIADAAGPQ